VAAGALQWGCTTTAPPGPTAEATSVSSPADSTDLAALYAQLAATEGRVLRLQPAASRIRIYVFRGGRSVALGHNHVLSAPAFEGWFWLPEQGVGAARFDLLFRLDQLVFDLPAQRAEAGPAFASVLSEAFVAATREHMLGAENMQAERYPLVQIRSLGISGEAPHFAARVAINLHGQTREQLLPLTVTGLPQRLQASGSLVLRQSDFGVQPYSVLGGLLAVQDEVLLEFSLVGE
jgi:hypothetical protein